MKKAIFIVLIIIILFSGSCTTTVKKTGFIDNENISVHAALGKDQCIADILYYKEIINTAHVNPYRFLSQQDFNDLINDAIEQIRNYPENKVPILELYAISNTIVNAIKDSHTTIYLTKKLNSSITIFPYDVVCVSGKLFCKNPLYENLVCNRGAEFIEINDIPVPVILEKLKSVSQHISLSAMENEISKDFSFLYSLYFLAAKEKTQTSQMIWKYKIKEKNTETTLFDYPKNKINYNKTSYKTLDVDLLHLTNASPVPILEINSFYKGNGLSYSKFKKYLKDFFKINQNEPFIVIDIRRNSGGHLGWILDALDYLIPGSYKISSSFYIKNSKYARNVSEYYYDKVSYWKLFSAPEGKMVLITDNILSKNENNNYVFTGIPILLFGEDSWSAATSMALGFQYNKMGISIGRPTDQLTSYCGNTVLFQFPNSLIFFGIPLIYLTSPYNSGENEGINPTIERKKTLEELLLNIDEDMDLKLVKEYIENGKMKKLFTKMKK